MQTPTAPLLENESQPIQVTTVPADEAYYNNGSMYGQQTQGQAPEMQQPSAPMEQGQYQPTDAQLMEGVVSAPGLVVEAAPTQVVGTELSDGIGMQEGCRRNPHVVTWILTIAVWGVLTSILLCNSVLVSDDGYCGFFSQNLGIAFGILGACAVFYWIECACTGTARYLSNVLQNEGAEQYVERLKASPAELMWTVRCYHWETRTRVKHVTDKDGNRRTEVETYREKVYTWRANSSYAYTTCLDVSGQILGLTHFKLTKLRFHKTYGFVDLQSQNHYIAERRRFRMMNWRDRHQEFFEEFRIPGFTDRVLAEAAPGIRPGWMNTGVYWICNLLFLSPCFRHRFSSQCGNVQYTFIKQLSAFN